MKFEDKLFRRIKRLSKEIAILSAYSEDNNKDRWWGYDTEIGNLPFKIQKKLSKFIDKLL